MARIFITLPGGKLKRISGRFRGGETQRAKEYDGDNRRLELLHALNRFPERRRHELTEAAHSNR